MEVAKKSEDIIILEEKNGADVLDPRVWSEIKTMFDLRWSKTVRFSSEWSLGIKVHACDPNMQFIGCCPHE